MKSNSKIVSSNKIGELTQFLKRVRYIKNDLINGSLKEYISEIDGIDINNDNMEAILDHFVKEKGIDWLIVQLSADIYEKFQKTISVGQIIAIMHKVTGVKLSSTERSQLHELRKKIRRYDKFLKFFGEWGKNFDFLFKTLIFGLNQEDSDKLDYLLDKAVISAGKQNIGVEFYTRDIEIFEKSIVRLQIWEISTQSSFETIRLQYYRGAAAAIIFFYTDKKESFNLIKKYISELKDKTNLKFSPRKQRDVSIDMPLAIVGLGTTSKDLYDEVSSLVKDLNGQYFDFINLNYDNFDEILKYITSHLTLSS